MNAKTFRTAAANLQIANAAMAEATQADKMTAEQISNALIHVAMGAKVYGAAAVRSLAMFSKVVACLNIHLKTLSKAEQSEFKADGPVKILRNACLREKTAFSLKSDKNGLQVISRSDNKKATGKARTLDKVETESVAVEVAKTLAPDVAESTIASLTDDAAKLRARILELESALTIAESRAKTAESELTIARAQVLEERANAEKATLRAESAESALRAASTLPTVKTGPVDAEFRNIREGSPVASRKTRKPAADAAVAVA